MLLIAIETLILAILAAFFLRTFVSLILAWRHVHQHSGSSSSEAVPPPPISIIKPVRGLDQGAEENCLSFIDADYPAPYEVLFCVEEREDPAVALIQRLIARSRSSGRVQLIFSQRQDQRELGKTINLMAGIRESQYEHLILSDSDVRNTPGFLAELVAALREPGVGMAYAAPVYREARDWIAGLMALTVNETILALTTAPPFAAIGSSIAIRKDVLQAIGGLGPLRHRVGIDAALGRAVRTKEYRIALIKQPVSIIHHHATLKAWWQQLHRWLVTIRRYLGPGYLVVLFYGLPLPWATLYLLLAGYQGRVAQGLTVLGFTFLVRLASVALVNLFFVKEPTLWRYLWLIPVLELLKIPLWLEGFWNPVVVWRGRKYRVMADATVRPVS